MDVSQYTAYKLAKAIYKINALIPATSADTILQAAGVQMAVTSRFQNVEDRLSKSSVRLVRLCAIPDPTYILMREGKIPKRSLKITPTAGQIELIDFSTGAPAYLSLGLSDDGVPFHESVPPIDLNPHIALTREERLLLLKAVLIALYNYEPSDEELASTEFYYADSFRPYYELLTEFLLHIPRELQEKFEFILKNGGDVWKLNGSNLKRLVYIFTKAMEHGRYAMFDEAQKFVNSLPQRSRSKEFVYELFTRFGIVPVEESIRGPGRRPPITDEGRKRIVDAAMYLTVFLSPYILRLRKTKMGEILREFAYKHEEYFGITGELGDNFLSRILSEAWSRRFRRICLMIRPSVEGVPLDKRFSTYFVLVRLRGSYFRVFRRTDTSISVRRLLHEYFGSTSFIYERKQTRGSRVNFDLYYASSALSATIPGDMYPPSLHDAQYLVLNDYRISQITSSGETKIYYKELTPEDHFRMITLLSEAFLPKNELYDMAKEFVKEYVAKNKIEDRSPTGAWIAAEALFF